MRTLREKQQQINDEIHTLSLRFVAVIVYALVFESKNIERKKYFFFRRRKYQQQQQSTTGILSTITPSPHPKKNRQKSMFIINTTTSGTVYSTF